jgi:hypothetical protein
MAAWCRVGLVACLLSGSGFVAAVAHAQVARVSMTIDNVTNFGCLDRRGPPLHQAGHDGPRRAGGSRRTAIRTDSARLSDSRSPYAFQHLLFHQGPLFHDPYKASLVGSILRPYRVPIAFSLAFQWVDR